MQLSRQGQTHLGVDDDVDRLLLDGALVDKDGAQAVRVAHDGYPRVVLDAPHERVAPARDDEVDVPVLGQERRDLGPRRHGLDVGRREGRRRAVSYTHLTLPTIYSV